MPAERHISDLASFRYAPPKRAYSKTQHRIDDASGEPVTLVPSCDPASLREAIDFSECEQKVMPFDKDLYRL
jgi:hypothetical protein